MDKTEWLEKRKKCITGTDIASIVGLNPYGSPMSVFMEKIGLSEPIVENEAMAWGKYLEPVIAQRYAEKTGIILTQGAFIQSGIFGGTPDYLSENKLIEIKTAGIHAAKKFGESGSDDVPDNYICQVQWYLNLTGRDEADLVALLGGQEMRVYPIRRNQALIDKLKSRASEFWEKHIIPQEPPPIDKNKASTDYLKSFFPRDSRANMIRPTPKMIDVATELNAIRNNIKNLTADQEFLENQLKEAIGENAGMLDIDFKITWKMSKESIKTDWKSIAEELGASQEIIDKHSELKPGSRRFLFNYLKG